MTSTRLPGKVLLDAVGKPLLEHMVERLKRVPSLAGIVIATTTNTADDLIAALADRLAVGCYRGSEYDVMGRVLGAALAYDADVIVRTTGDCPLIDPETVERVTQAYLANDADYVSNVLKRTYPRGMDTEIYATATLADAADRTDDPKDREHVSLFIHKNPQRYQLRNVPAPAELTAPEFRLTVDEPADYELIRRIFEALYPRSPEFALADIVALMRDRPELAEINRHIDQKVV